MHFLIGLALFVALIAFGFGESMARIFIRSMFMLLGFVIMFVAYDIYHARYQAEYMCVSTKCLK